MFWNPTENCLGVLFMMYPHLLSVQKNHGCQSNDSKTPDFNDLPPAPKKPKQEKRYPISGIACAILNDNDEIFLFENDRHHWPEGVQDQWKLQFLGDAPKQVYTVTKTLDFLGETYDDIEQARAIVQHMVSKKWYPKVCFSEEPGSVWAVTEDSLKDLHKMLQEFTQKVENHHYLEMVFGAVDSGPTKNLVIVDETLRKEMEEEAGLSHFTAELVGYSEPFESRGVAKITAIYKTYVQSQEMIDSWAEIEKKRRNGNVWRYPYAWFKFIPNINKEKAEREKAIQETRNGKWYPMQVHPRMDRKNISVIKLLK